MSCTDLACVFCGPSLGAQVHIVSPASLCIKHKVACMLETCLSVLCTKLELEGLMCMGHTCKPSILPLLHTWEVR